MSIPSPDPAHVHQVGAMGRGIRRGEQHTRKFLPTNLPTENGSYSPFQRLAAPVENVSR